ncbi:MAG: hypothetical protein EB130_01690 [Actinobacteria bacterium]|nr:hypothetical protein [Actinomycetota bacterium]
MVLTALATSIVLGLAAPATAQAQPASATRATTAPSIAPATLPANASQTAARPNTLPVLGDANDDVVRLQQAMVARGFTLKGGVDGVFSARTQATLRNLQKAVGLKVSGTVDEPTARFLGLIVVTRLTPETLPKSGDQGEAVWTVQQALINNGVILKGGADGAFGVATTVALGTFQSRKSLPVTKTLDHATAFALGLVDVAPPAPVRLHEGVDIIAPRGNLIYAVVDGTITKVYNNASLTGNGVRLTMADGTYFFYAHLDTIAPNITVGTVVKAGQILGTNGSTGNTTTPHLHFEVHPRGGAAIDPTPIVAAVNACHITEPRPQP